MTLTVEKMNAFEQLLANNGTPAPEDIADFEIFKAIKSSTALAGSQATPTNTNANVNANPNPITNPDFNALTPVATPNTVVPTDSTSYSSALPMNGSHFTMEDLASRSMAVDKYLKVKYQQTFIGEDIIAGDSIYVYINMDNVVCKLSIKGGSPVTYVSTLDGKTTTTGGSWIEAVADIRKKDQKAQPYNCVDIPMTVAKEIKNYAGQTLADVGTILGHTTSTTNWRDWLAFYQALPEKNGTVLVKIGRKDINKNKNQWGLLTFSLVSDAEAQSLGIINQ